MDDSWQSLAKAHREKQQNAIPQDWRLTDEQLKTLSGHGTGDAGRLIKLEAAERSGILSETELDITTHYTASQVVDEIRHGRLKTFDVVLAYCKRAAVAQHLTSCLTEIFFDEALERARWLDKYYAENGKTVGPLHGLPVSLKDSFVVKGHHATVGLTEYLRRPVPQTNAALVDLLIEAGAVLYCKTNVPQTLMTAESHNNIFGRVLNPHNTELTACGSTGGEGALIAFHGSPLGVGTDIGGSIRGPALCNGIYGFKPTANRVPLRGQNAFPFPRDRFPGIPVSAGPMANSVQDLNLFMEVVAGQQPWRFDATCPNIPWTGSLGRFPEEKLRIGVLPEAPENPFHPPVRRVMHNAVVALEKAGHRIIRLSSYDCPDILHAARIAFQFFGLLGGDFAALELLLGEPLVPSVLRAINPFSDGKYVVPVELDVSKKLSMLHAALEEYSQSWKSTWVQNELDVVIAPASQHTAVPHDNYGMNTYTVIWSVLNYPAGVIPFGKVSKTLDSAFYKAQVPFDPDYDPEMLHDAPTAIQVIAPIARDEDCLSAMRIIDRDIRLP